MKRKRQKQLYARATAVVANTEGHILLVKHNRQREWALPGGHIEGSEKPSSRAKLEVAEETGLVIGEPEFLGYYAGSVASHQIFFARASGTPVSNRREVKAVTWWDRKSRLDVQQHVSAILAIAGARLR